MLDLESVMDYLSPFAKYLGGQPVSNSCPGRRMARIHRRASQLPPTGNGNVSIMAVVDDRSRENAKYPGGGGRRGRKRRGGGSRCILSRPIYIYIPAPISRHSICPRVNLVDRSPTINLATVDSNLLPPWAARRWGWGVGGVEKKRWARCD